MEEEEELVAIMVVVGMVAEGEVEEQVEVEGGGMTERQ